MATNFNTQAVAFPGHTITYTIPSIRLRSFGNNTTYRYAWGKGIGVPNNNGWGSSSASNFFGNQSGASVTSYDITFKKDPITNVYSYIFTSSNSSINFNSATNNVRTITQPINDSSLNLWDINHTTLGPFKITDINFLYLPLRITSASNKTATVTVSNFKINNISMTFQNNSSLSVTSINGIQQNLGLFVPISQLVGDFNIKFDLSLPALSDFNSSTENNRLWLQFGLARKVPDAPINVLATSGNATATVSYSPPIYDGLAPITHYTVTIYDHATNIALFSNEVSATDPTTNVVFNGLTNGNAYKFTARAKNSEGYGPESAFSNIVTPMVNNIIYPCFTEGAKFITPDSTVNVENLKKGDSIKCEDGQFYEIKNMYVMPQNSLCKITEFEKDCLYPDVPDDKLILSQAHFVKHDGNGQTAKSISPNFNKALYVNTFYHIHVDADARIKYAIVNNMLADVWGNLHPYIHDYAEFIQ
jgi:hypothetical protein